MPTTVQAFPHRDLDYVKNLTRAKNLPELIHYAAHLRHFPKWIDKGRALFDEALHKGGVWHLYGHSWEIEELGLWNELKEMLSYVSNREGVIYATNSEVRMLRERTLSRDPAGCLKLKIALVHNVYQQPGGEDSVFRSERDLLKNAGHEIVEYVRSNEEVSQYGSIGHLTLATRTIWAGTTRREFRDLLLREKPDVVHVHNTFVTVSPSIYWACDDAQVPIVQAAQNFRLLCPGALFLRDGKVCEECIEHGVWRSVRYGCYRDSRAATAVVAGMLTAHRVLGTWSNLIAIIWSQHSLDGASSSTPDSQPINSSSNRTSCIPIQAGAPASEATRIVRRKAFARKGITNAAFRLGPATDCHSAADCRRWTDAGGA